MSTKRVSITKFNTRRLNLVGQYKLPDNYVVQNSCVAQAQMLAGFSLKCLCPSLIRVVIDYNLVFKMKKSKFYNRSDWLRRIRTKSILQMIE